MLDAFCVKGITTGCGSDENPGDLLLITSQFTQRFFMMIKSWKFTVDETTFYGNQPIYICIYICILYIYL